MHPRYKLSIRDQQLQLNHWQLLKLAAGAARNISNWQCQQYNVANHRVIIIIIIIIIIKLPN
jgi:hypothetical protein